MNEKKMDVILFWYIVLMGVLYLICGSTVVLVILIILIDFDYYAFAIFEYYTIIFFFIVSNVGSSYERRSANIFLIFFGFVMRFGVLMNNNLSVIGFILMILGLAKLPIYGLHM
jgi:hypothetical protein